MHNRNRENLEINYEVPIPVVEKMYHDMVMGESFVAMKRKWYAGGYSPDMKENDFDVAMKALARYTALNVEKLENDERARLYARYLAIYKTAMDVGQLREAKGTLDSMAKLLGLNKSNENVEVSKDNDSITISFGLKKED